ncbi:histone-lysine N-methyltransferase SETMAR-like [Halyomorpha halys]|uniref:histone-lysine N-methyltransferase SETMAR-like n=1 Tax=Halyomorpha halys TaxID=286706 RepID=UPI0034D1E6C8
MSKSTNRFLEPDYGTGSSHDIVSIADSEEALQKSLNEWNEELKIRAAEAALEIIKYEEEGILDERTARRWFEKFSSGDTTMERKMASGLPSMNIDEVLQEAVESNLLSSTCEFARECGVSKETVSRHLLSMGKVQ